MRSDAVGFFWNDAPVPRAPKAQAPKRQPPARTWESPDYLPGLEEAMRFPVDAFSDHDLMSEIGGELYFDIETYPNFFQVAFKSTKTGKVIDFMLSNYHQFDYQRVKWITENFTLKGFNSWSYDIPMLSLALARKTNEELKEASDAIIKFDVKGTEVLKMNKLRRIKCDHIDLFEVAPLTASLKIYAGRVHTKKMQDLPFNPETFLSWEQMNIVRWYCVNDLNCTRDIDLTLTEQRKLRALMSEESGIDLRSKSDAQIAEATIGQEIARINGCRPQRPEIDIGTAYRYKVPAYMQFQTPGMQALLERVRNTLFVVDHTGSIGMPPELSELQIPINNQKYTMGLGGLHSTEKKTAHRAQGGYKIFEVDVESYYPRIILNQGLYPQHLGPAFLDVFRVIVERRIHAKHIGDKSTADSLKITINGTFGKLGSMWSILYAPDLLIQTTVSGQLTALMLIEMAEMYGIEVISSNTDGICFRVHESMIDVMRSVVKYWEQLTSFKTEETEYLGLYSKDVNNYIAVKKDGKFKHKGLYANPWLDSKNAEDKLKKNPAAHVCVDAVIHLLTKGVPVQQTITTMKDFTKFVAVRTVAGGAVKDGIYLGKACRWYYAQGQTTEMVSAKNGNKVPKSDGAKPCMQLPDEFPSDIDYDWYIDESEKILKSIGYYN